MRRHRRDMQNAPTITFATHVEQQFTHLSSLGVKWSQVQILSARPGKAVLTCCSRSPKPQSWFSYSLSGTTSSVARRSSAALVRWSSEPRIQVAFCHQDDVPITSKSLLSL